MKVRATVVADFEMAERQAFERYGVTDVYSLSQMMQAEGEAKIAKEVANGAAQATMTIRVEPLSA